MVVVKMIFTFFAFTSTALAQDFDIYCKQNLKGKMKLEKRELVCLCIEENFRSLFSLDEKFWILSKNKNGFRSKPWTSKVREKILLQQEFDVFKNCTENYQYRFAHDDLGVPDHGDTP